MFDPSNLKIVFFDVGNVFVSDDPSGCFAYRCLFDRLVQSGHDISAEEFFRLRTEHVSQGGGLWSFVAQYVPEAEFKQWQTATRRRMYNQWGHLSPAITSMAGVPAQLAPFYRLGIIANQPEEVEQVLAERDLLQYFDVLAISDKVQLHKPDPALFQWAVEKAGVQPDEALMVGDRIGNDIVPAKAAGMRTAWLRLDYDDREWRPQDDFQKAYAASVSQIGYRSEGPRDESEKPDLTIESGEQLLRVLLSTSGRSVATTL